MDGNNSCQSKAMRPLRALIIYVMVIFLGGALLAPWLYWLTQWAAGQLPVLERLAQQPFHRFLNRSLLGVAVIGLWPFLRSIGANSWAAVGLVKPAGQWKRLATGIVAGFGSLACVALVAIAADGRKLDLDFSTSDFVTRLCTAGLWAVTAATLEELLFRGALFGALRKTHHWLVALIVSSLIYAIVHFFKKAASPTEITWSSGFELLPRMLSGFAEIEMLVPGFFTLALAGMILALAYHQTGNLYFSTGLHAGWIFWLKLYGFLTDSQAGMQTWFWGTGKLIDGWLALIVLLPMFILLWFSQKKETTRSHVI